jgi:hypothetical protein
MARETGNELTLRLHEIEATKASTRSSAKSANEYLRMCSPRQRPYNNKFSISIVVVFLISSLSFNESVADTFCSITITNNL